MADTHCCLHCPDRVVGCHAECEKYKTADEQHQAEKERRRKAWDRDREIQSYETWKHRELKKRVHK